MKLPIVSRKKYDILQNNYKVMSQARQQIGELAVSEQEKRMSAERNYSVLQDTNREIGNRMEYMAWQIDDLKKENKKLKALLTRNGIKYKKEEK